MSVSDIAEGSGDQVYAPPLSSSLGAYAMSVPDIAYGMRRTVNRRLCKFRISDRERVGSTGHRIAWQARRQYWTSNSKPVGR
eukprot:1887037-Rhodomonas_salina.2